MAKQKPQEFVTHITPRSEDFSQWYTDVILQTGLCDYAPVRGKESAGFSRQIRLRILQIGRCCCIICLSAMNGPAAATAPSERADGARRAAWASVLPARSRG